MIKIEFKTLTTVESSFKQIRLFSMIFIGLCAMIVVFALYKSYNFAEEQRRKIYVLDKGKSLMLALSQDAYINRPVEAREHIRRFHELFFTLAPDNKAIENNIKRAFFLADESAFDYYKDLAEKGYYNRIISGNIQQRIVIDRIQNNFDTYPYQMVTYAKQWIIRASNKTQRSLVTSCELVNFSVTTLKLLRENDSLQHRFNVENLKLKEVSEKLIKEKSKKGISIFEGVCIGVGAFSLGALIF